MIAMHLERSMLLRVVLVCAMAAPLAMAAPGKESQLSEKEIADGWILLFDGQSTFGWQSTSDADWKIDGGVLSARKGAPGWLRTTSEFGDYLLSVEFRKQADTNSGVFLRMNAEPRDPTHDCYEINIAAAGASPFATGSLVGRQKAAPAPEDDQWHHLEAQALAGDIIIKIDRRPVLAYHDPKPLARGFIGLQFKDGPIEFRSVKLKPLALRSIFNGKDLSGWKVYPGKQSVFAVTPEGALRVTSGPGQLESAATYGDFILQLEVFSGGKLLNSGIFFRSIPGEFAQGYESQIHNGYRDGDRTRPIDCGTGGFYRRQNARKVVADDFRWFAKTLVVSGNHMAAWVDGYQVSDWTDTRADHENPRKGSRRAAGTLSLQGHDPTTNLSFRNIRAAEMPVRESKGAITDN